MNIQSILNWFRAAVPTPTNKNRAVQIGCHFEEAAEMAASLNLADTAHDLHAQANYFKKRCVGVDIQSASVDRLELLDSLCDQIVTATGVGHMFGFDILGALAEVNRSNYSKFVDGKPQFDENGKIMKPATYSPPDLRPFLTVGSSYY